MQQITLTNATSLFDFDYGEGWIRFEWIDTLGMRRSLKIDCDQHCSREMAIRSGSGVTIEQLTEDCICLRFPPDTAAKLELDEQVTLACRFTTQVYHDLQRLAEYF